MWNGVGGGTICAIATGSGVGGIAVLRVSGPQAWFIVSKCCKSLPANPVSHHIYYTSFTDHELAEEVIDSCLVSYFEQGRSFTGEQTVEISCHGGMTIPHLILNELIVCGARLANPGEFTARAFLNGKLDLVQAEAVLQLIQSGSKAAARLAIRQLKGDISARLGRIEENLIWALSHLEASIDYSEQGVEVTSSELLISRITEVQVEVQKLLSTHRGGQSIRHGFQVAIVGKPNVGKSSLLNAVAGEDRAIVTEYAGTTRDFVEAKVFFEGVLINFVDTAGLRASDDPVERVGIQRSIEKVKTVDLVLHIKGPLEGRSAADVEIVPSDIPVLNVRSKGDLGVVDDGFAAKDLVGEEIVTSAKTGAGIDLLLKKVCEIARSQMDKAPEVAIQARHFESLKRADECLGRSILEMSKGASAEFVAFDLQRALDAVFEVSGKRVDEEILDRVFKEFCLGK